MSGLFNGFPSAGWRVSAWCSLCLIYLLGAAGSAAAATIYDVSVDGSLDGPPPGSYSGLGDASLTGTVMNYSHTGHIVLDGGFDVTVTYTGSFDLLAETGSVVASNCIFNSGIVSLCDSLIQNTPINLNVSFVSGTSGSPITVIADDGQGVFTHTFSQVVPIPAAAWLFGSALAGLGWLRRKQTS